MEIDVELKEFLTTLNVSEAGDWGMMVFATVCARGRRTRGERSPALRCCTENKPLFFFSLLLPSPLTADGCWLWFWTERRWNESSLGALLDVCVFFAEVRSWHRSQHCFQSLGNLLPNSAQIEFKKPLPFWPHGSTGRPPEIPSRKRDTWKKVESTGLTVPFFF